MSSLSKQPAFPETREVIVVSEDERDSHTIQQKWNGMTLHQYYAGKALQGLLARHGESSICIEDCAKYAKAAADLMIEELEE